jgi:hypothetical protein
VLAARLGQAVAGAVELSVAPEPTAEPGLAGVAAGVDEVVNELQALRAGLADASEAASGTDARQPPG